MTEFRIKAFCAFSAFFFYLLLPSAYASEPGTGVFLGATRVIFSAGKGEAWVAMNNTSSTPFLVQSWVDAYSSRDPQEKKFIVTPPLYRQETGSTHLRIIPVSNEFDKNKESVFMLNVKTIPAGIKSAKGTAAVQFAYQMKIKLFYRPEGLSGKPGDAFERLKFSRAGNMLTVSNPTPYFVTFRNLSVGGVNIADVTAMVPPLGSQSYPVPGAGGGSVKYKTINDFGGVTPERTVSL
ncbi:molecular chaperone [Enterobacter ludwigii]|uniref:fimbrial biogenesis chaperone n=1 Tax=Enterobacter ludwigii TaxID=299767 RepID=UPI0030764BAE